jgi:hypothetical protein
VFYRCAVLGILGLLASSVPAYGQSCQSLNAIGGDGTQVRKIVSAPGMLISRNNYNTDFGVPGGAMFDRFVVDLVPEQTAKYNVSVYLKYSDGTKDQFYRNSSIRLLEGQPLKIPAIPRRDNQPYQVNVRVGDIESTGNKYSISVAGCVAEEEFGDAGSSERANNLGRVDNTELPATLEDPNRIENTELPVTLEDPSQLQN